MGGIVSKGKAAAERACGATELLERVEREAAILADTMKELHGGWWRIHIDHGAGLVAVSRDCSASANSA